jgi:hypothetical protein
MEEKQVLRWLKGRGWLVLSGGADKLSEIRAMTITRNTLSGAVAYIGLSDDDDDDLLEDFGELGAPYGYWVNVMKEDDQSIRQQLSEAAVIVIPGNLDLASLRGGLLGAAVEGIREAYSNGAVILAEGIAATLFGKVAVTDSGTLLEGIDWVNDAVIVPAITSIGASEQAQNTLLAGDANVAIGIGVGSALVLGPDSSVETWGKAQVTIALGGGSVDR